MRRGSPADRRACCRARARYILQDGDGNIELTHSVSAGLDYAAVGPEHAWLRDVGRTEYTLATDDEAREAFQELARLEGILPALESAHAVAGGRRLAAELGPDGVVLVNLSGRGDKDMGTMMEAGARCRVLTTRSPRCGREGEPASSPT